MQEITQQQLSLMMRNKSHFYRAFEADGYYMPDNKSSFCTKSWLEEVFFEDCWCPKKKEISFQTCLHPPPGREVCDIICRMIEDKNNWDNVQQKKQFQRLAVHMRRHLPPREWMLGILSHLQPNNDIFVKGYRY